MPNKRDVAAADRGSAKLEERRLVRGGVSSFHDLGYSGCAHAARIDALDESGRARTIHRKVAAADRDRTKVVHELARRIVGGIPDFGRADRSQGPLVEAAAAAVTTRKRDGAPGESGSD